MRILLIGANGFIGTAVEKALQDSHEVFSALQDAETADHTVHLDLLKPKTIEAALREVKPQAILNCAGIVSNNEAAAQNVTFTTNLLNAVITTGIKVERIIITGSASEYGIVKPEDLPVNEDLPLDATSMYGRSKLEEVNIALDFRNKHNLPVVIARIFNPIGSGMHERMLIPQLIKQVQEIKAGQREAVEVSRLDSKRDYINVSDVALAYKALVEKSPAHTIYNIGSGKSTTNKALIELILRHSGITTEPQLVETMENPEPLYAIQADVSRIQTELGWAPEITIDQTVKEIADATKQ